MKTETVRLNRVTVQSRGSVRLNDVNLHIYRGEIMGLICVNQYGLDTLISLLCQNIPIHYGHVYFRETLVNSYQSSSARLNKTAVIDRNSRLVEHLTVSDNIFVMRPGFKKFIIPEKALDMQLDRLTRDIGVSIRGASRADGLPPFERCAVELLRAVASGTALVILRDVS
ncbi:MAG: sugar ABC transporter ATP-binding protein, partial [Clostridiales bacterium]|nr:sugar ABC transporter ATP-binding protein [Clostridiales bacterium]